MTCHSGGATALEYYPCRYGNSRVLFRGPRSQMQGDYIAFLGGSETYGRFIADPFPSLLERDLSIECVNFGAVNVGIDLYLNDPSVLEMASGAVAKVIQVTGAQNMSNRYYMVHPRRNDRFLRASERLETLYPEVDFTEFHFNRHMLSRLCDVSQERFEVVVDELRQSWVARMKHILTILRGKVVLLWFADHAIPPGNEVTQGSDPLYVTRAMLETLRPRVQALIEVTCSEEARMEGTSNMVFSEFEACAAAELMGALAHREACDAVAPVLRQMLGRSSAA